MQSTARPCSCAELGSSKHFSANQLSCCYGLLYSRSEADLLLSECESKFKYLSKEQSRVKVYGKWHDIPRQQCAYGDPDISYKFSGAMVSSQPWPEFLSIVRDKVSALCGCDFNFVLVNRYKDGIDYMGEHQDNEKGLDPQAPIASLSLGRGRDFVFRHKSVRHRSRHRPADSDNLKIELRHGTLLVMNPPTNNHWYHSLPARKQLLGVRVNMTFRKLKVKLPNATPSSKTLLDPRCS
ncbi:DNA oxidative demethylase ALKBH2-like [Watersipora subatra]|uniref:DNA oxidative demethylase ALKBH2-like n=1 Tax=Watersipora subatra TaxID=2589382 RepID=UPI00355BD778